MSTFKHLLLCSAILAAYPAVAQEAKPGSAPAPAEAAKPGGEAQAPSVDDMGRIVVTARRIAERLIDVPLSIVAMTGKDLQDRGVTSIADLSLLTPGLSFTPEFGRTGERPVVRGIAVSRNDSPQPVSIFIDGAYVRDGALSLGIEDAQRIEVIKGPQSALYGRSTYAGAVNYVTNKPGDKLTGKVSVTIASDADRTAFGALTVPLVNDLLSMRVRLKHAEFGGQYTNSRDGSKLGTEKSDSAGLVFSLRPGEAFDAQLALDASRVRDGQFAVTVRPIPIQAGGVVTNQNGSTNVPNGGTCNGRLITMVGTDPRTGLPMAGLRETATNLANGVPCGSASYSGTSFPRATAALSNYTDPVTGINYGDVNGLKRDIDRGALTLNWHFGDGYTLTSQTALTRQDTNGGFDQSYNGTIMGLGSSWLTYDRDKLEYKSQELRLTSPTDGDLSWMLGAFYYKEETEGINTTVNVLRAGVMTPDSMRPKLSTSTENIAPFGRIQYQITPATRASFEGRYSEERVSVAGSVTGERTFTDFAPRVILDHKPNKNSMLYAQVARGSKSGGFNTILGLPPENFSYEGEKITALEIGSKNRLLDGAVLLNVSLFQNNISGLQLSNPITYINPATGASQVNTVVNNLGKARTRGLEAELAYQAAPWLMLTGNYAYTDAKALKGLAVATGRIFGGDMSVAGAMLTRTPKHSFTASAAADLPLASTDLRFTSRIDVSYQSRRYADLQNMIWADGFTRVNLNAGVRGKDWRAVAFVRNATNDKTPSNAFSYVDAATFRRTVADFLPRLRQYGITVSYDY